MNECSGGVGHSPRPCTTHSPGSFFAGARERRILASTEFQGRVSSAQGQATTFRVLALPALYTRIHLGSRAPDLHVG